MRFMTVTMVLAASLAMAACTKSDAEAPSAAAPKASTQTQTILANTEHLTWQLTEGTFSKVNHPCMPEGVIVTIAPYTRGMWKVTWTSTNPTVTVYGVTPDDWDANSVPAPSPYITNPGQLGLTLHFSEPNRSARPTPVAPSDPFSPSALEAC